MVMKESLWDLAVKNSCLTSDGISSEPGERHLILAGSRSAGKSAMIHRFLDKEEPLKETLAMEYLFGRKSGRSLIKDICHVWEIGGGAVFANLLPLLLSNKKKNVTLILVVDLSTPETLWHVTETIVKQIDNQKLIQVNDDGRSQILKDHEDYPFVSKLGIRCLLIGGKYDLFEKKFNPEKKKAIVRTLRLVAHSLAGSLLFYSDNDPILVKRLKEVFNHYGFGGPLWKTLCTDFMQPVSIMAGSDSFEQIGVNRNSLGRQGLELLLDRFKHAYTTCFPQSSDPESVPEDPAKDENFKESVIDGFKTEKDEELERYLNEKESRKKHNAGF